MKLLSQTFKKIFKSTSSHFQVFRSNLIFIYIFLIFSTIQLCSCDTTEPSKDDEHPILEWDIDTIKYPGSFQTSMNTIWGNSLNDLWIAGHNNRGYGKAFHFDGKEWKDFLPVQSNKIDSYIFNASLNLKDEVFLAGSAINIENDTTIKFSSLILLYKDHQWSISQLGEGGQILSMSGDKNGKLYASGWDLTLFSYEQNKWIREIINPQIPEYFETKSINSVHVDKNKNGYMVIYCYNSDPYGSFNYFLRETETGWQKIDSFNTDVSSKWGLRFWENPDGDIYSYNPDIYKLENNNWVSIFNQSHLITAVNGTGKNNIWAAGQSVFHFNGIEWYEYKELFNKFGLAREILLIEDNVIILFSASTYSYVIKGESNK